MTTNFFSSGKLYQTTHKTAEAKSFFSEAVTISEGLGDYKEMVRAYYRLGVHHFLHKEYDLSNSIMRNIIEICEQNDPTFDLHQDEDIFKFVMSSYRLLQRILVNLEKPLGKKRGLF